MTFVTIICADAEVWGGCGAAHVAIWEPLRSLARAFANTHAEAFCFTLAQEPEAFPEIQWRLSKTMLMTNTEAL